MKKKFITLILKSYKCSVHNPRPTFLRVRNWIQFIFKSWWYEFHIQRKKGFSQAQIVLFSKAFLTIEKASKQNKGEIELNPEWINKGERVDLLLLIHMNRAFFLLWLPLLFFGGNLEEWPKCFLPSGMYFFFIKSNINKQRTTSNSSHGCNVGSFFIQQNFCNGRGFSERT